jgi:hypothetical protein
MWSSSHLTTFPSPSTPSIVSVPGDVVILTPYNGQLRALLTELKERNICVYINSRDAEKMNADTSDTDEGEGGGPQGGDSKEKVGLQGATHDHTMGHSVAYGSEVRIATVDNFQASINRRSISQPMMQTGCMLVNKSMHDANWVHVGQ